MYGLSFVDKNIFLEKYFLSDKNRPKKCAVQKKHFLDKMWFQSVYKIVDRFRGKEKPFLKETYLQVSDCFALNRLSTVFFKYFIKLFPRTSLFVDDTLHFRSSSLRKSKKKCFLSTKKFNSFSKNYQSKRNWLERCRILPPFSLTNQ